MTVYPALLHKDPASDYGVEFPDFPGCVTAGRTIEEALRLAPEALALHVKGMVEDGLRIPTPSSLADVSVPRGVLVTVVELPPSEAVRVNLTVPAIDLALIDRFVRSHEGESRSGVMVKGALELIGAKARPQSASLGTSSSSLLQYLASIGKHAKSSGRASTVRRAARKAAKR